MLAGRRGRSSQSTFAHLAHDDELVAVRADRAVVVEAVAQLRVAADHVRGLQHRAGHRVVDAAALPVISEPGVFTIFSWA